jgi:serine acetyltransferase
MNLNRKVILVGRGALAEQILKKIRRQTTGLEVVGTYITSKDIKSEPPKLRELDKLHKFELSELDDIPDHRMISAIGYSDLQRRLTNLSNIPFQKFTTIDLSLANSVDIPLGCFIDRGSIIDIDVEISRFCHIDISVSIGENTVIGSGCYIANNATICGSVKIGCCTMIGAGSLIYDGVVIGNNCKIGAGAIIQRDVLDNTTVFPQQKNRLLGT